MKLFMVRTLSKIQILVVDSLQANLLFELRMRAVCGGT